MTDLTPREIVHELDRFVIGQKGAKRAVAIALRNRWRRRQLDSGLRDEIYPKNILMIGPTGVGKTEISRRLAKLARAPFLKVEATKFTEVGYVGRDVEQIIRDLVDTAMVMVRQTMRADVREQAHDAAENRIIDLLAGAGARESTRDLFRKKLRGGDLDEKIIEIEQEDSTNPMRMFDIPGMVPTQGGMGAGFSLGDLLGKAFQRTTKRRMSVAESHDVLIEQESDRLIDDETIRKRAIDAVEQDGIVFIDEIDKVCARTGAQGADISREGVQRDLLPLIEGTTVNTRHGQVKTDHILFITSGAFHTAKPSDLLPELQGRLPIRVELHPLAEADFARILTEPDNALTRQYKALMQTEGIEVNFTEDGVAALARMAASVNETVENIGARRLHTILERLFEDLGFCAPDRRGETVTIDAAFAEREIGDLARSEDTSRYIL